MMDLILKSNLSLYPSPKSRRRPPFRDPSSSQSPEFRPRFFFSIKYNIRSDSNRSTCGKRKIFWSDVVVKPSGSRRAVYWGREWGMQDKMTVGAIVAMHALSLFAPFTFTWPALLVAVTLYFITGLLGITLSFHRNLAHRSFVLPKWLEYSFAYFGVLALQGVRTVWVYHITWLVNSACHVWGRQRWNTGDLSRNNWWVAVLAFGEGWHNNHHAFEYSARHGLEWWEVDATWYVVWLLEALGLATDVKLPSQAHKQRMSFAVIDGCSGRQ